MNCIFLRRGYGTSGDGVNYVEYIGSDGAQYIDTGFVPNQDTRVVCEFDYTTAGYVFGAEVAYKNKSFDFYTRLAVYNATAYAFTALSTGTKHTADFNKNVVSVDGSVRHTFTYAAFNSGKPLYLFCVNQNGAGIEGVVGKIYSCQIYDNGSLVRDFRPVLDPNGVACMYEELSKTYYYNKGTGIFTAGASISDDGGVDACTVNIKINENVEGMYTPQDYRYVSINGVVYDAENLTQTVVAPKGSEVVVACTTALDYWAGVKNITLNGVEVASVTTVAPNFTTYAFTLNGNANITISGEHEMYDAWYGAAITTE